MAITSGLTTAGAVALASLLVNDGLISPFNNSNAYLGVGNDNSTAFNVSQTALIGASQQLNPVDTGYPVRTSNSILYQATFYAADAIFDWSEYGIFNAASAGTMLVRVAGDDLGTKTGAEQIVLQITLVISTS